MPGCTKYKDTFYRLIEVFFIRSSFPHHHHHRCSMKSETTSRLVKGNVKTTVKSHTENCPKAKIIANGTAVPLPTTEGTNRTKTSSSPICDNNVRQLVRPSEDAQPSKTPTLSVPKTRCCSTNSSSQAIINKIKTNSITNNCISADYRRNRAILDLNSVKSESADAQQGANYKNGLLVSFFR